MHEVRITSAIKPTHKQKVHPFEAWQFTGQPISEFPDWIVSHYGCTGVSLRMAMRARKNVWALRDEDGYFWRWMDDAVFNERFEPLS